MIGMIQARMSSKRLPGKVLKKNLAGKELLSVVLDRVSKSRRVMEWTLVTSSDASDDPIAEFCGRRGVQCFRGSLDDVAGRFLAACAHWNAAAFVRISADSPWMDAAVIDACVEAFERERSADLATNVFPRSYPKGVSVEVVSRRGLERASARMTRPEDREHVTTFFYSHPQDFAIRAVTNPEGDSSTVNLCVDTEEDWRAYLRAERELGERSAAAGWKEVSRIYAVAGGVR